MYETYFHFQTSPFPAMPVVGNYFPTQAIETARQSLVRIVERAEGPGLVIGPTGVGKTLLLRVLADHFADMFRVALLSGTRIDTRKALLQTILFELGIPYRGMDEGELRLALIDCLRPSDSCPNGILLLVDEAHTLSLKLLDEIRMITNVVREGQPRARLVLAGGTALEERFANPKLESFNQRVAARCYLQSFTRDETFEYIRAQIAWAGADPDSIFPDPAIRAVYQATDGIPRLINQICDHALVMARDAGVRRLEPTLIQEAWADLQQLPPPWHEPSATSNTAPSTVIEFGPLEDEDDEEVSIEPSRSLPSAQLDDLSPVVELDFRPAERNVPQETEEDLAATPEWELEPEIERELTADEIESVQTMSFCGTTGTQQAAEWIEGMEFIEELPEQTLANNPFEEDHFEEEVVVIDRHAAWEIEAFRGRPRVSCDEGRQLASHLSPRSLNESPLNDDLSAIVPGTASEPVPAFQFTTIPISCPELIEPAAETAEAWTVESQLEADLEEEIESVPLPWMGTPGDDRDVIIVEDDLPDVSLLASEEEAGEQARRIEYRQLFAQLRRATT